jgi:hypothetical protein
MTNELPAVSSSAPADRAALRQQIIDGLYEARRPGLGGMTEAEAVAHMADAVLAALPAPAETELRKELAASERIRENADFHLGQEMSRRQLAEKETGRLCAVVARLRQMTDYWEQQLPDVIRTPAVVSAIRAALEAAEDVGRMADETPQPVDLAAAQDPTPLRWGLNDVLWGDDDTVTVLLSGPAGEPYWLALDPERAGVLREDLAGPDGVVAVDRAAVYREVAEVAESFDIDASPQAVAAALRRLADESPAVDVDEMAASLARDGFGADEIAVMLADKRLPMDPVHILGIGAPAVVAQQPQEADGDRIVAYQSPGGTALFCTRHRDELSPYWPPVFSEDLPDGGICAHSTCGADLLIPQQPEAAEGAQQ